MLGFGMTTSSVMERVAGGRFEIVDSLCINDFYYPFCMSILKEGYDIVRCRGPLPVNSHAFLTQSYRAIVGQFFTILLCT